MKRRELFFVVLVAVAVSAAPALASGDLFCSCTASTCGYGGIEAGHGVLYGNLSRETVNNKFKPDQNTGWTCVEPAAVNGEGGPRGCFCPVMCGSEDRGVGPDTIALGFTKAGIAEQLYIGDGDSGWVCGPYRGTLK